MNNSYWLIFGFSLLTLLLVFAIAAVRMTAIAQKKHGLLFKPDGTDISPLAQRLSRAHANCLENLPVVLAVIFIVAMRGQLAITDSLALIFLLFRIAQTGIHVISTSSMAIMMRFVCYLVQCLILIYWFIRLCCA